MEYADIAALFVTMFLGAFLAFGLENLRERRHATDWIRQHLKHVRPVMAADAAGFGTVTGLLASQIAACEAWIAARDPDDLTEDQWEAVILTVNMITPDWGTILRSDALMALPPGLAVALAQTEQFARIAALQASGVAAKREQVMPLWYERSVPLSAADARRVRVLRDAVAEFTEAIGAGVPQISQLVAEIDRWSASGEKAPEAITAG